MVPNTRDYYPGFLQAFTGVTTNLITREARAVLGLAPNPGNGCFVVEAADRRSAAPIGT
jgi:hypothetical protein